MACIKRNIYLFYLYFEGRKMIFEAIRTKVTISTRGGSRDFAKGARGALYVGWPTKKMFGFIWFKKAKITLETISFQYFQIFPIFI